MKSVDRDDRPLSRRYVYAGTILLLIGAGLGAMAYRFIATPAGTAADLRASAASLSVPNLIKKGQRIEIPEGSPLRNKLIIEPVVEKTIERTLVLPAVVEADPARLVKVLPPLSGRITQLQVQLGQPVEVGQPLAVLESSDLRTAYADYDRAKVLLELATKNRDRLRNLVKTQAISVREVQQAETDFVTAEAEFQRAEARLNQIGAAADTAHASRVLTISSPISGSVIDLAVAPGAFWNDPNSPLMTVADLTTIWVTANVPEKDIALVAKDQRVDVNFSAYPGEVFHGLVLFVSQVLDPDTRRAKVRIAFPNPDDRLKPAMFASVTFFAAPQTVSVVPTDALVLKKDSNRVFVETAPWTFEPRPVKTGFQQGDQIVIQEGLKAGDRIVVKGGVLLND
jgi:cobalt-zinc-cadmium efflux system membrane fusion protein